MDDFATAVQALRPQLLRFAQAQLRNAAWAEDAVSDTVLAAIAKPQAFAGQSQLKTWLVGILKHKLVDQIRRHSREVSATTDEDEEDIDGLLFREDGGWREAPADWGDPEAALRRREFFEVLELCVEQLPGVQGRLFMMRRVLSGMSVKKSDRRNTTARRLCTRLRKSRARAREVPAPRGAALKTSASKSAPVGAPTWSSMTLSASRSAAKRSMVRAKLPPRAANTQLVRKMACWQPLARISSSPSSLVRP